MKINQKNQWRHPHQQKSKDPSSLDYLVRLYEEASSIARTPDGPLARKLKCWEGKNGKSAVGPLKRPERIFEKTFEKHSNDFSKVCDIARASIVFKTVPDLLDCLETIVNDSDVDVSRVKAKLAPSYDSTNAGGYRDVLINLRLLKDTLYTSHVVEVRVVFECEAREYCF